MGIQATDSRATCEELESFLLSSSEVAEFVADPAAAGSESASPSGERRKRDRAPALDKYVELEALDGEWIADAARVVNTSAGGMCVEVFRRVSPETMLNIWFETDKGERRYALGRVVHRSRKGRGFYLGVQLMDAAAL